MIIPENTFTFIINLNYLLHIDVLLIFSFYFPFLTIALLDRRL
jgi:hypothetical protein